MTPPNLFELLEHPLKVFACPSSKSHYRTRRSLSTATCSDLEMGTNQAKEDWQSEFESHLNSQSSGADVVSVYSCT